MKAILATILTLIFFIVGCSTENKPITNIEWQLKTIAQESIADLKVEKIPTINFSDAENKVAGTAGCNNYFGTYVIAENKLELGSLGSTQMACPNLDLGSKYLKLLDSVDNYQCDGNTLNLYSGKKLVLEFIK